MVVMEYPVVIRKKNLLAGSIKTDILKLDDRGVIMCTQKTDKDVQFISQCGNESFYYGSLDSSEIYNGRKKGDMIQKKILFHLLVNLIYYT